MAKQQVTQISVEGLFLNMNLGFRVKNNHPHHNRAGEKTRTINNAHSIIDRPIKVGLAIHIDHTLTTGY